MSVTAAASYLGGPLPGFITFNGTAFQLNPLKGIDSGSYEIKVNLYDGF